MRLKNNLSNPFSVSGSIDTESNGGYFLGLKGKKKWSEIDLFSSEKSSSKNKEVKLGSAIDQKAVTFWIILVVIGVLILFGRTAYLQLMQGSYFKAVAEGNRIRIRDIKANRGVIYDRHRNLLVENLPSFSLAIIPVDVPKEDEEINLLVQEVSKISGHSKEEIKEIIDEQSPYSYQPVIIAENLNHDQAILTRILSGRFSGVVLRDNSTRHYLQVDEIKSLSHLLGYVGKLEENKIQDYLNKNYSVDDKVGKTGLEINYESELKGINGREQVEVDATGEAKEIIAQQKSVSGKNLVLTIDAELQKVSEDALQNILDSYGKKRGSVIVMDPNSGEVLAMVNLPAFNNNLFSQGISQEDFSALINDENQPLFTRAISGEYPSGSTFKMIVAAAALNEGIVTVNTGFMSTGGIGVSLWWFPDWKAGGHGWTNVTKALAESVNTYFYIVGGGYQDFEGLGVEKMKEYAEMFGLNKKLGIDLPHEADGFFPSIEWKNKTKGEKWYIGDTYHLAIGQGDILVTPLQVAAYTSVFANGGTLYKPYLVKEILDKDNNLVKEIKPEVLNDNFISEDVIKIVNRGLRQGVLTGSSRAMNNLPVTVAAKTGTAQWSSKKDPHAWLTAFAPYKDPRIVVTVLVEEGIEGSSVALPVAREIINWWANNR